MNISLTEKSPMLTKKLERMSSALQNAFDEGLVGVGLRESRSLWKRYRINEGYSGYANLLTLPENQKKLGKSDIFTVGLTLQHANVSGVETCAWRGHCTSVCVLDNGNGRYNTVQEARNTKTRFLSEHPEDFVRILASEIKKHSDERDTVLVRMNVNSDIRWYSVLPDFADGHDLLPNVMIYDYTKNPSVLGGDGKVGKRYRNIYSVHENSSIEKVREFVARGGTAALVTDRKKNGPVMPLFMGLPMVDGDTSDDRYNESGVWVDLAAKGKARTMPDVGFVRKIYS